MSWTDDAFAYLKKHREYVEQDKDALRTGVVRILRDGEDVTESQVARYERQLAHIDRLLTSFSAE